MQSISTFLPRTSGHTLRRGWASVEVDNQKVTAYPGEWLICQAERVRQVMSDDAHLLSVRCLLGWPDGTAFFSGGPMQVISAGDYPALEQRALKLMKLLGNVRRGEPGRHMWELQLGFHGFSKSVRLLLHWLEALIDAMQAHGAMIQTSREIDPRLTLACNYLNAQLPGDPFPKARLVELAGLSLGQLNRLCLKFHGCSLTEYSDARRLDRARLAVQLPHQSIKTVAYELGFSQLSHFSAWFKRHTGLSPRQYREKNAGDSESPSG